MENEMFPLHLPGLQNVSETSKNKGDQGKMCEWFRQTRSFPAAAFPTLHHIGSELMVWPEVL